MVNFNVKDGFKYLVVETGYATRLIENVPDIQEKMREIEDGNYECNCETYSDKCSKCDDFVLFIEDHVCGDGVHEVTGKSEEVEKIRHMLSGKDITRARIVLRCSSLGKAMNACNALMEYDHCACFNFDNLYEITVIDEEILVMRFDCESG